VYVAALAMTSQLMVDGSIARDLLSDNVRVDRDVPDDNAKLCNDVCGPNSSWSGDGADVIMYMCRCEGWGEMIEPTNSSYANQRVPTTTTTTSTIVTTTRPTTTTPKPTKDICRTLCALQLGGNACRCSNPSLPGR